MKLWTPDPPDRSPPTSSLVGRRMELDALFQHIVVRKIPLLLLQGTGGIGKTALVSEFVRAHTNEFPGGVETHYAGDRLNSEQLDLRGAKSGHRSLLILEEAEALNRDRLHALLEQAFSIKTLSTLVVARQAIQGFPPHAARLSLGPLSFAEWNEFLQRNLQPNDKGVAASFYRFAHGHPALLSLAFSHLTEATGSLQDVFDRLQPFEEPGILGADGRPLGRDIELPPPIVEVCSHLEQKLFEAVAENPDLMYTISPRDFELLVAELLHRQGYDIQVTPPSKDGGVDLYAAKSSEIGQFLFLVECKRYARSNPVQVDVVRSLYGNVQAKKATSGVIVTTSTFTRGAKSFQSQLHHQLQLKDYLNLRDWIAKVRR
ncbi:putative AAA domain-containing protein [Paraburkholderia caribensis]|nr:putative AAA domain-containing protein [Paraburkholderia caribensis]